jgi:hypothetical protein
MRKALAAAAIGCAVVSCASSAAAPAESPRQLALAEAATMLAAFGPPSGAVSSGRIAVSALSGPPEIPATADLATRTAWWRVPGQPQAVLAWVSSHPPAGVTSPGRGWVGDPADPQVRFDTFTMPTVPGVFAERSLIVSVAADGAGITAMRVDAQVTWLPPKPASERIPAAARVVTITPLPGAGPAAPAPGAEAPAPGAEHLRPVTITSPATVARIAAVVDGLPRFPPGFYESCPMDWGKGIRLTFRATLTGPVLAVATGDITGCEKVTLTVGGKQLPALWHPGQMQQQVLKIAGIHWPGF